MNFLAHCALALETSETWGCNAQERTGLLAGAVIGDFVKGRIPEDWPAALRAGVRVHRRIDALSNVHPAVRASNDLYPKELRRLAPIFTDLLGDHFLSLDWARYHANDLPAFSQLCYAAIDAHAGFLPARGRRFQAYMVEEDLLASYDNWRHVQHGLQSVLRRLSRTHLYDDAERASRAVLDPASEQFHDYYPGLASALVGFEAFD